RDDRHAVPQEATPEQLPLRADDRFLFGELGPAVDLGRFGRDVEQLPVGDRHASLTRGSRTPYSVSARRLKAMTKEAVTTVHTTRTAASPWMRESMNSLPMPG